MIAVKLNARGRPKLSIVCGIRRNSDLLNSHAGRRPNLRIKDASSSSVLSAAVDELTATDFSGEFSDREDIFTAKLDHNHTLS